MNLNAAAGEINAAADKTRLRNSQSMGENAQWTARGTDRRSSRWCPTARAHPLLFTTIKYYLGVTYQMKYISRSRNSKLANEWSCGCHGCCSRHANFRANTEPRARHVKGRCFLVNILHGCGVGQTYSDLVVLIGRVCCWR